MKDDLKSLFTEHWKYMAVNTACKLNLFDAIENKQLNANQLAEQLNLDNNSLETLLKALVSITFLESERGIYFLNEVSLQLTENHPKSLKYASMVWADEHLTAWQNLDYSIKTGESSFSHLKDENYFDYLNNHPEQLDKYHKAMFEYARDDYATLPLKIDFKNHKSIMDVGGGYGAAISVIKANHPAMDCALLDLKKVIENCDLTTIKVIEGDFFLAIPSGYEALLLSRILHDWNDEKCKIILDNCFKALPKGGTLYVIENCSDLITVDLSLLSLNMLAMCESYERTLSEYTVLVSSAGFIMESTKKLNDLQTILLFEKP
ncbi:methyltransferase [Flavobacterium sp. SM2513]|uniref:methyltransferase n=1 Tax=Flavobacterium sp. SM2513 TaxID=3424766 RepID=UPI003D7F42EF